MALMTKSCQFIAPSTYTNRPMSPNDLLYKRAGHGFDEASEDVYELGYGWFVNNPLSQDTF
jgi:hypothetical protein